MADIHWLGSDHPSATFSFGWVHAAQPGLSL